MIKGENGNRSIDVTFHSGGRFNNDCAWLEIEEENWIQLDRQGVDALIKELEEVREKLPKKKVKHTRWLNLYPYGVGGTYNTRDSADQCANLGRLECREITWEVEEE